MERIAHLTKTEILLPPVVADGDDPRAAVLIEVRDSQLEFEYEHYDDLVAESIGYPDYER